MNIFLILFVISLVFIIVLIYLLFRQKINYATLYTSYISDEKASVQKIELLQNAKNDMSMEFKVLANKIFEDKSKQFNHSSKEQFEQFLKPFREQISNFSNQSREQFNTQAKDGCLLKEELLRLKDMNIRLSGDAQNLTNALKGDNKTQGNWGEIILERILEESGLRNGIEYETQASLKSQEGKMYRPDVIVHMPQERDIVIDSKVSLVAYEKFMSSDDKDFKEQRLKEHMQSIFTHIKELSAKNYEKLDDIKTLDYILLFMPIEGAFHLALGYDGEFFKNAYDNNILIVSPSTLLVTLRTIEHIWRTQKHQDNADEIASQAEAMYDKLVGFVDSMDDVGKHLQKAQDSYDSSMNRLKTGRGNLIKRAQNIVNLGVKPKKLLKIKSE